MKNTEEQRAGDTANINAFEGFGEDALSRMDEAKGYLGTQQEKALQDINTNRAGSQARNRGTARGVNTMRSLDLASESQAQAQEADIYDNFSKQMMQMLTKQAGFENEQDLKVMAGEQGRDLADREDRDAYYSQMAKDIATKGTGIQQAGKMLNQSKANTVASNAVGSMSTYFSMDGSGNLTDKNGVVFKSGAELLKIAEDRGEGETAEDIAQLIKEGKI
jgi:hypothetical protein